MVRGRDVGMPTAAHALLRRFAEESRGCPPPTWVVALCPQPHVGHGQLCVALAIPRHRQAACRRGRGGRASGGGSDARTEGAACCSSPPAARKLGGLPSRDGGAYIHAPEGETLPSRMSERAAPPACPGNQAVRMAPTRGEASMSGEGRAEGAGGRADRREWSMGEGHRSAAEAAQQQSAPVRAQPTAERPPEMSMGPPCMSTMTSGLVVRSATCCRQGQATMGQRSMVSWHPERSGSPPCSPPAQAMHERRPARPHLPQVLLHMQQLERGAVVALALNQPVVPVGSKLQGGWAGTGQEGVS